MTAAAVAVAIALSPPAMAADDAPSLAVAGVPVGERAAIPGPVLFPALTPFPDIGFPGTPVLDGTALADPEEGIADPDAEAAEAAPEDAEAPPALVGPDDDRILHQVEQHTTIAPPEPAAIRLEEPTYDIPLEVNAKVLDYVELFQTERRRNFENGLVRSRKYEALMKPIFREEGVPTDLFYLALIESGYNPKAYSYARAMGIWQFISSTGRLYGLRRTAWVDERCDPVKATRAAARHLRDLHAELGSWPLVLAAYNAGKGRVERAIAKAGTRDFWSLPLPAQTRNYVPAYFAALLIAKDPPTYGFQPVYEPAPAFETVEVEGGIRLSLVAALCNASVDEIRTLNPELRTGNAPPGGRYALRVPEGSTEELVTGLAKIPPGSIGTGLSTYRIVPGDTLRAIALRFGTSVEDLQDANRLRGTLIRAGEHLVIPGVDLSAAPIPRAPGRVVAPSSVPASHAVRRGETAWGIAQRFGLPLGELLAWNDLDEGSVLRVGQRLALRPPAQPARTARRSGGTTYEVRRGDSLWQISRRFDTSVEALRRANGLRSHTLRVGQVLTIP